LVAKHQLKLDPSVLPLIKKPLDQKAAKLRLAH